MMRFRFLVPMLRVGMPSSTLLRRHFVPAISLRSGRGSVQDVIPTEDPGNEFKAIWVYPYFLAVRRPPP
jgi:hypothetical protein